MLVLVTRPRRQAAETARLLRAAGHDVLLDPLLEVRHLPPPTVVPYGLAAVAVTSANAAPAASTLPGDIPVFAVGAATARALRGAGREPTAVAGGDGRALARLIARTVPTGVVLHPCGSEVREGLAEELAAAGFGYRPVIIYEAVAAGELMPTTSAAIRERRLGATLFYSPRSAALFSALVRAAELEPGLGAVIAACLSEAVATELAGLAFGSVRIAAARDQNALLRRLEG